ncbi:methionyl-tRNA formyltransferase [Malassezia caprae]|uniref:methionyl-tRNA formyltransferase n=1 Tax=Malassezia caprae TaxID=1381934 RepID=A0AAF0E7E1_9BASI|nr:methionyl-tRNA formyltransferase [Malassezia caprae]
MRTVFVPWRCAATSRQPGYVRTFAKAAAADRARSPPYDTLFCGTDQFACVALQALLSRPELCRSLHVLTPPDVKHAWGAKRMRVSPVKQLAEAQGLPTLRVPPTGLDDLVLPDEMTTSHAPLLLTASFGHRIPSSLLQKFPNASHTLNLHPSMLPDLRGAAPLQWAIARQYRHTGITVQQLHPTEFDHGGILKQVEVPVPPGITYSELEAQLARRGAQLLIDVVASLPELSAHVMPQDPQRVTRAPKLQPKFSVVRWDRWDAATCDARMRAFGYMVRWHAHNSNRSLRRSFPRRTQGFRLCRVLFWPATCRPRALRTVAQHWHLGKARLSRAGTRSPCKLLTAYT